MSEPTKGFRRAVQATDAQNVSCKLGTFGGVFAPSLLTILGLVLFLRLGFVTGNVGMAKMLLILGLSTAVSLLTTISLAALATNMKVGGGGVYFLISRTLGPIFGGAIGLVLYLAMSVSVAFYAIGLGEALASVLGSERDSLPRLIAALTIVGLLGLAWLGADVATRLQYVVLGCLAVAIVGYLAGVLGDLKLGRLSENMWTPEGGKGFWFSFAIFFPAITGFTQGVAMSGDLKTPSRSISVGTFGAIGVSTVVYLVAIVTLAMAVPLVELQDDTAIMRRLAVAPWLIDLGVIAATLSSAIASMMGAPRTLQRLAADQLIKPLEPFAKGTGVGNNPRRGIMLTAAIALLTVALADLDLVAPIISMFFLVSYGMINYATYSEARAASTSFRPRFKYFDWRLSLVGTLACLAVVVAIDPVAGAVAGVAVFALYRYLNSSVEGVRWVDSTRGFHTSQVRSHLRVMDLHGDAGRDWRPCTVAFVPREPDRRERVMTIASWLEGSSGFTTAARLITGEGAMVRKRAKRVELEMQRELHAIDPTIYGRVIVSRSLEDGVAATLQTHGIGPIRPNLALFGWHELAQSEASYGEMLQTAVRYGVNSAVVHTTEEQWARIPQNPRQSERIAVWWEDDQSGELLSMLAWLCTRNSLWRNSKIQVWVSTELNGDDVIGRIRAKLDDARLPVRVVGRAAPVDFARSVSRAAMVFAPIRVRKGKPLGPGGLALEQLTRDLPVTVFVKTAVAIKLDMQPDETEIATLATAEERAKELTGRADELSERAGTLLVAAEVLRMSLGDEAVGNADLIDADRTAATAQRSYLDARTRADMAWRAVHEVDPTMGSGEVDPELWLNWDRSRSDR